MAPLCIIGPLRGADRELASDDLLLLDSGGHYRDGTTDITRTIAIGTPPKGAVAAYSHVLQSHIHLAVAKFPEARMANS